MSDALRQATQRLINAMDNHCVCPECDLVRKKACAVLRAALAEPASKPLTVIGVRELAVRVAEELGLEYEDIDYSSVEKFVRIVEAAHGIGGDRE